MRSPQTSIPTAGNGAFIANQKALYIKQDSLLISCDNSSDAWVFSVDDGVRKVNKNVCGKQFAIGIFMMAREFFQR